MTVSDEPKESAAVDDILTMVVFLDTAECSCCKQLGLDGSCVTVTGNHCSVCPAGQFQDKEAQDRCDLCPAGW